MNRDILLKILSAMPDQMLLKALEVNGLKVDRSGADSDLAALSADQDPDNKIKGWSSLTMAKGQDDRPSLADKNFIVEKQKPNVLPGGMPIDVAEEAYSAPGGF